MDIINGNSKSSYSNEEDLEDKKECKPLKENVEDKNKTYKEKLEEPNEAQEQGNTQEQAQCSKAKAKAATKPPSSMQVQVESSSDIRNPRRVL